MSTKKRRTGQSSSRSEAARKPPQQLLLPDDIEKENAAVLDKLPREVWKKIVDSLRVKWDRRRLDHFPFAMTCRYFRDLHQKAVAAAAAATDWTSFRWTTELKTLLASYSYIEDEETNPYEVFPPRINEFYEIMIHVSADFVKWLFREARSTYCREAALEAGACPDGTQFWDAAEGERRVMELAAAKGDLDLIKWLRSQDPPYEWSKKACTTAAAWGNHFDLLRLLVSMGCPIDEGGMFGVVARDPGHSLPDSWDGKLEILKWLQREHGCIFGAPDDMESFAWYDHVRNVAKAAVKHNDLECLKWVVEEQGIPWGEIVHGDMPETYDNADVCRLAAESGHLEILQYAVEDGCPWVPATCLKAAEAKKHYDVVEWITDGPH